MSRPDPETDPTAEASSEFALAADAVVAAETEYLDLDGDGLPDAVRTTRVTGFDVTGDGIIDVVETVEEVASEIGVAGQPEHITITDTVETDFEHDGTPDIVETVEVDVDSEPFPET